MSANSEEKIKILGQINKLINFKLTDVTLDVSHGVDVSANLHVESLVFH